MPRHIICHTNNVVKKRSIYIVTILKKDGQRTSLKTSSHWNHPNSSFISLYHKHCDGVDLTSNGTDIQALFLRTRVHDPAEQPCRGKQEEQSADDIVLCCHGEVQPWDDREGEQRLQSGAEECVDAEYEPETALVAELAGDFSAGIEMNAIIIENYKCIIVYLF